MILGLDISTSKIGYCILDDNKKIIANEFMKLKPLQLEDRAEIFYEFLSVLNKKHNIDHVFIILMRIIKIKFYLVKNNIKKNLIRKILD